MLGNINTLAVFIPTFFHQASDSEDEMASPPSDSRRSGMQRRDSSRSTGGRRPRLLRSSATEPSITTSTASRNALATPGSSRRATDLLNQVAISGSPPAPSSPLSQSPTLYDSPERIVRDHQVNLDGFRPHLGWYGKFEDYKGNHARPVDYGTTMLDHTHLLVHAITHREVGPRAAGWPGSKTNAGEEDMTMQ
ncbi:hypothetical protein VM1G_06642 [Cytospora mali]|uniref:Uncharacterized protein n=1 Tax=Cytospora mali TaxID=578113 RepID=A0A194W4P4_CYTMA|nr:hypothetical protein VM1G_06642 [Valsa mali]